MSGSGSIGIQFQRGQHDCLHFFLCDGYVGNRAWVDFPSSRLVVGRSNEYATKTTEEYAEGVRRQAGGGSSRALNVIQLMKEGIGQREHA